MATYTTIINLTAFSFTNSTLSFTAEITVQNGAGSGFVTASAPYTDNFSVVSDDFMFTPNELRKQLFALCKLFYEGDQSTTIDSNTRVMFTGLVIGELLELRLSETHNYRR